MKVYLSNKDLSLGEFKKLFGFAYSNLSEEKKEPAMIADWERETGKKYGSISQDQPTPAKSKQKRSRRTASKGDQGQ